jgi:hypothetical protein
VNFGPAESAAFVREFHALHSHFKAAWEPEHGAALSCPVPDHAKGGVRRRIVQRSTSKGLSAQYFS